MAETPLNEALSQRGGELLLPDGRPLRVVGLYQSQVDDLVPANYRPVESADFFARLRMRGDGEMADSIYLSSATYRCRLQGAWLVSDRSELRLDAVRPMSRTDDERTAEQERGEPMSRAPVATEIPRRRDELSLGKVNLAIDTAGARWIGEGAGDQVGQRRENWPLGSRRDGELIAGTPDVDAIDSSQGDSSQGDPSQGDPSQGDSSQAIEFAWRLRGRQVNDGQEFELLVPPAPRATITVDVGPEIVLESADAVCELIEETDLGRTYRLEIGGRSRLRLRAIRSRADAGARTETVAIRESSIRYDIDTGGLRFEQTMLVELPATERFPVLRVAHAVIDRVSVGPREATFRVVRDSDDVSSIRVTDLRQGRDARTGGSIELTVRGRAPATRRVKLPVVWIDDRNVLHASPADRIAVTLDESLRLIDWELPDRWQSQSFCGGQVWTAIGPPIVRPVDRSGRDDGWSTLLTSVRVDTSWARTLLRVDVGETVLSATAQVRLMVSADRVEPIAIEVQDGWTLESLVTRRTGRRINFSVADSVVRIWPQPDDIDDRDDKGGVLVLTASGTRLAEDPRGRGRRGRVIPPTWFVRPLGTPVSLSAALAPPPGEAFTSSASFLLGRTDLSSLPPADRAFLNVDASGTVCFGPSIDQTPRLELETPASTFSAVTRWSLRPVDDDVIEEVVEIGLDPVGGLPREIAVLMGPEPERGPLTWSFSGGNVGGTIGIPASDVRVGDPQDGLFTIQLDDEIDWRGRRLVGRRRYRLSEDEQFRLPSVLGATRQQNEALLGEQFRVISTSPGVARVPTSLGTEAKTKLRYDGADNPSVSIRFQRQTPSLSIVWSQRMTMTASSGGTDRIEMWMRITPSSPIVVEYDLDLSLDAVTRDGISVPIGSPQPGRLILQPQGRTEWIQLQWSRFEMTGGWIRACQFPNIRVNATVLKVDHVAVAAPDSFIPGALWRDSVDVRKGPIASPESFVSVASELSIQPAALSGVLTQPEATTWVLRRSGVLAIGPTIALFMFAGGWSLSRRGPRRVAMVMLVATTVLVLWWPWRMAIAGWVIIPMTAGAMLSVSDRRHRMLLRLTGMASDQETIDPPDGDPVSLSLDVSWARSLRRFGGSTGAARWPLWLAMAFSTVCAFGQGPTGERPPVTVLVPHDGEGNPSGEIVYLPDAVYHDVFVRPPQIEPPVPTFRSANYRVNVSTDADDPSRAVQVDAEFTFWLDREPDSAVTIEFPLDRAIVQSVQRVGKTNRKLFFTDGTQGGTAITLPRGRQHRIVVSLLPESVVAGMNRTVRWDVPPLTSTELMVESEGRLGAVRLGGRQPRALVQEGLRRWTGVVGPQREIELNYRLLERDLDRGRFQRRFWVTAGIDRFTIEAELESDHEFVSGESVNLSVGQSPPCWLSSQWSEVGSENRGGSRGNVTLIAKVDRPGPIRAIWTVPRGADQDSLILPELEALGAFENESIWLALADGETVRLSIPKRTEPLAVDQFLAAWSGYRAKIDRAVVSVDEIGELRLDDRPRPRPSWRVKQRVELRRDSQRVHYRATLEDPSFTDAVATSIESDRSAGSTPVRVRVPPSLTVLSAIVDGHPATSIAIGDEYMIAPLSPTMYGETVEADEPSDAGTKTIDLIVGGPLAEGAWTPPLLQLISDDAIGRLDYEILRGREVDLRTIQEPTVTPEIRPFDPSLADLEEGLVPVCSWALDRIAAADAIDGRYDFVETAQSIDVEQVVTLSRAGGRWSCEIELAFVDGDLPEFVDVELPGRWCANLTLKPDTTWYLGDATESNRQLLRISCHNLDRDAPSVVIRGELTAESGGRVDVPHIDVLGGRTRSTLIGVPIKLVNESIRWQTRGVRREQSADRSEGRQRFFVAAPSWNVELAAVTESGNDAVVYCQDSQVFSSLDQVLVLSRFDLYPGREDSLSVRIPDGATCLGCWSAGRAVPPRFQRFRRGDETFDAIEIQLTLSRLAQSIELLIRVPAEVARRGRYLPMPIRVPVVERWITQYYPNDRVPRSLISLPDGKGDPITDVTASINSDSPDAQRGLTLAWAVVDSIERSLDALAELPAPEIAIWLGPWLNRYRDIAASMGHGVDLATLGNGPTAGANVSDTNRVGDSAEIRVDYGNWYDFNRPFEQRWNDLDARIGVYASRYPDAVAVAEASDSLFPVSGFEGFKARSPRSLLLGTFAPPIEPVSRSDRGLRLVLINTLALSLVIGMIFSLRSYIPFAAPVIDHPACWLLFLGLMASVVAPFPVAGAVILVALVALLLPNEG